MKTPKKKPTTKGRPKAIKASPEPGRDTKGKFTPGNKAAVGEGRQALYDDPEVLESKCVEYFANCEEKKEPLTITGLAFHLGFSDKSSLYDYRDKPRFFHSIKKALLRIECEYEKALRGNNVAGSIFALKNMNWKDKTEAEITGKDGKDLLGKMSEDELNDTLNAMLGVNEATKILNNKDK